MKSSRSWILYETAGQTVAWRGEGHIGARCVTSDRADVDHTISELNKSATKVINFNQAGDYLENKT